MSKSIVVERRLTLNVDELVDAVRDTINLPLEHQFELRACDGQQGYMREVDTVTFVWRELEDSR